MPKKYTRKHASKAVEARKAFLDLGERADANGLPKSPTYEGFPTLPDTPIKLAEWLNEVRQDPFRYSMILQAWLHLDGLPIPKGVFKEELNSKLGRPLSTIGVTALALYKILKSWHEVARRLVLDEFRVDQNDAAKYVKNLAETAKNAPDFDAEFEDALASAAKLLLDAQRQPDE